MSGGGDADAVAAELATAPPHRRRALWSRARRLPAIELAWALQRRCEAAWSTDPPATQVVASLIERLAARHMGEAVVGALAAWTRGIALLSNGRMAAALDALERAAASFDALGRRHDSAQTQVARLMALAMLGRYDEASACGAQARDVFDAHGDTRAAGKIELNLGNLAARRDRHDEAATHFRAARDRFVATAEAELEVMATTGLADMLARRHDFAAADALYAQALQAAEHGGFTMLCASIEGDVGALEMRRGRFDRALRHLERSRQAFERLQAPHYLAVAEESLADAYLELNLLPEALALFERSLSSYDAAGLPADRAWALSQRGRTQTLLGRHAAAADSLAQAAALFAAEGNALGAALVRVWSAELALARGAAADAAEHARVADAPLRRARHASWQLAARALRVDALRALGDTRRAEALARRLLADAQALQLLAPLRRARVQLGLLARDRGAPAVARRHFEAAVASIESQRGMLPGEEFRAAFLGEQLRPYQELLRLSLADGGARASERALVWAERSRARSLADAMDGSPIEADDPRDEAMRLRQRLNALYHQLARPIADDAQPARWLAEVREIEAELLEAGRRRAVRGDAAPATDHGVFDPAALRRALGAHSALVEYLAIDDALLACIVTDAGIDTVPLPLGVAAAATMVEQLRFQTDSLRHGAARLAHRLPELQRRALHHLQALRAGLWAPFAPRLGERRAVVVPHGALHYLPFEALHDGRQHEIERREMCRAPSAGVLLRCLQRRHARFDRALLLGHGDERLPQVQREIDTVAAVFGDARALTGAQASAAALREHGMQADVLHIACHAQFRNDSPRFSALHLADGAFTVRDAARLRLRCGLLTLSACETGLSAVLPGDELIGLTHAFLSAGATSVLASLWTVHDDVAAAFMQRFYERLRRHGRPAGALRETQLEALQTHPHPYFWSAFGLHGHW